MAHCCGYDYFVSNPSNPNVRGVSRREIVRLFPGLSIFLKRVTLAPPITRVVAPVSTAVYRLLSSLPRFVLTIWVFCKNNEANDVRVIHTVSSGFCGRRRNPSPRRDNPLGWITIDLRPSNLRAVYLSYVGAQHAVDVCSGTKPPFTCSSRSRRYWTGGWVLIPTTTFTATGK